jgi:ABC-2 type transport system ATP-binding protein
MIEADSLTKRYGARAAVQDVSFSCAPGTVTGFLGPNGAGKSTTLKMLCGLARASSGRCTVLGVPFDSMANPGVAPRRSPPPPSCSGFHARAWTRC